MKNLESEIIPKRVILSASSNNFDPLGLLSPLIMLGKLIMQQLWQSQLGWTYSEGPLQQLVEIQQKSRGNREFRNS